MYSLKHTKQLVDELKQNTVICQRRADQLFVETGKLRQIVDLRDT